MTRKLEVYYHLDDAWGSPLYSTFALTDHAVCGTYKTYNKDCQEARPAHPQQDPAGVVVIVVLVVHVPYHMPGDIYTIAAFDLCSS